MNRTGASDQYSTQDPVIGVTSIDNVPKSYRFDSLRSYPQTTRASTCHLSGLASGPLHLWFVESRGFVKYR